MSEKNKRIDRRFFEEVWNRGNYDFLDEVIANDYVCYETHDEVIDGPEGMKRNITILRRAFPDLHFTIEDQIAEGDRVVTRWTVQGLQTGEFEGIPPTGRQVTLAGITMNRMVNGEFVEGWIGYDRLSLLQQLGMGVGPETAGMIAPAGARSESDE